MGVSTRDKIKNIKKIEQEGLDNSDRQRRIIEAWKDRGKENARDRKIFSEFVENAEKGKEENDNRFRMKYINDLNIPWNILIFLGKKNIGKTHAIHKMMKECIEEGREIVLVRSTLKEAETALAPLFNNNPDSPVRIRCRNGHYQIIKKPTSQEEEKKPVIVGFCVSITTLTSYQGASYDKIKYIVWDECISDGTNVKINEDQIRAFERFISSIVRDKNDVKVIIFGNLLKKVEGMQGDPLLNYYGIDINCRCKYIPSISEHTADIIFLNSGAMFKGIESQKVLGGVNELIDPGLLTNTIKEQGIKSLSNIDFYKAEPRFALLFTYDSYPYIMEVRMVDMNDANILTNKREPNYLIVKIQTFKEEAIFEGVKVLANESPLSNSFGHVAQYVTDTKWASLVYWIHGYLVAKRVMYADKYSEIEMVRFFKHLKLHVQKPQLIKKSTLKSSRK